MQFASREDAGRQLGNFLRNERIQTDLVLGLPRGGVVVAAEVARALNRPLDVLVVRKIGHPFHREFAVGALAEPDVFICDQSSIHDLPRAELDAVIAEEKTKLADYAARFHRHSVPELTGKAVLLVDDGIATGATTEAAILSARQRGARAVCVAAPVAATGAFERLSQVADHVSALLVDPGFHAVGQYYAEFTQTTDEEVLAILSQFPPAA